MSAHSYLKGLPGLLRQIADRLDPEGAPRGMSYSFTFEDGEGIRFRDDGKGCPLWHLGQDDYQRAHTEADSGAAGEDTCHVFWGSSGCGLPRGHEADRGFRAHRQFAPSPQTVTVATAYLFGEDLTADERAYVEQNW